MAKKKNRKNPKGKTHVTVGWIRKLEARVRKLEMMLEEK